MKKRKIILIICMIVSVGIIACLILNSNKLNGKESGDIEGKEHFAQQDETLDIFELEEPKKIEGEKEYKGLIVSNMEVQLISERECEVRANVVNKTEEMIEMQNIKMELYDKNGKLLETIGAQIDSVPPGGQTQVFAMLRRNDVSDIVRIEIMEN